MTPYDPHQPHPQYQENPIATPQRQMQAEAARANHHGKPPHRRRRVLLAGVILIALVGWGIFSRISDDKALARDNSETAVPTVRVQALQAMPTASEAVLPASLHAWHEAAIFPRVSGYIKDWNKDIGDKVTAGDVLAEIDTPETDADLRQAEADVATATANYRLSESTAKRWQDLLKSDAVTKQETDEKTADAAAKAADLQSSIAKRDRLRELEGFKQLVAPFDGIVTARNVDIGMLVTSGAATRELFHVATTDKLRVYVDVPENYLKLLNGDLKVKLRVPQQPGQVYEASFIATSGALDPATRTITAQFALDNPDGMLFPGGYAEAHLDGVSDQPAVRLPVGAMLFRREGLRAAIVGSDNKVQLKKITIGRDFGSDVEVISGLSAGDKVIMTPPDSIYDGEEVQTTESAPNTAKADK